MRGNLAVEDTLHSPRGTDCCGGTVRTYLSTSLCLPQKVAVRSTREELLHTVLPWGSIMRCFPAWGSVKISCLRRA